MRYFFDESGNWENISQENRALVIGGILIPNEETFRDLSQEINIFKMENNLKIIHMSEMDQIKKELFYQIILKYLSNNQIYALFYTLSPQILFSQTKKSPDELYIEISSDLIAEIAFGDNILDIEYDMKFHYNYPQNIVEQLNHLKINNPADDFTKMKKNFILKNSSFEKQKDRIKKNILKNSKKIENFEEVIKKINSKKFINDYLWEEFKLKIHNSSIIREKFKEKISNKLSYNYKRFNIPINEIKINIQYKNKYDQSVGVQIADALTNTIRYHGKKPSQFSSTTIKHIYNYLTLKEIKNV